MTMPTLNLTRDEAEYLFWLMVSEERDGNEMAARILNKLPIPEKEAKR